MKIIYGIEAYYINDENSISVVRGRSAEPLDGTFIVFDLETTDSIRRARKSPRLLLCALWRRDS